MDPSITVFLIALFIGVTFIIVMLSRSAKRETITCNLTLVINNTIADLINDGAIVKNSNPLSSRSVIRGSGTPRHAFAQIVLDIGFAGNDKVKISTFRDNLMRNRSFLSNAAGKGPFKGLDYYTSFQQRIILGNDDLKALLPGLAVISPYRRSHSSSSGSGSDVSYLGAGAVFADGYSDSGGDSGSDGGGGGDSGGGGD